MSATTTVRAVDPPAPLTAKLLGPGRMKVRVVVGSLVVLLTGAATAPTQDAETSLATPDELTAPLLEAEFARRDSLRAFERVQEIGGRVIGYSVSIPPEAARARRTRPDGPERSLAPVLPHGLGVVVGSGSLVLTHAASLTGGLAVTVALSTGTMAQAGIVAFEPESGLVLLRVAGGTDLPAAPLAATRPTAGALATAAGRWAESDVIAPVFVTAATRDAYRVSGATSSLPPGTPLYDTAGELFGILGEAAEAYPVRDAVARLLEMVKAGSGLAPSLGLTVQPLDASLSTWFGDRGAVVTAAGPGGPALRAGLRPGDVVTGVADADTDTVDEFRRSIALLTPGSEVVVRILRDLRPLSVPVTVGTVYESMAMAAAGQPQAAVASTLLHEVVPATSLEEAALPGDARVRAVNGRTVSSLLQAAREIRRSPKGALLYLEHDGEPFFAGIGRVTR